MNATNYKYAGRHLEPKMFEELAVEVCAGKTLSRKDIIQLVSAHHKRHGGTIHTNMITTAKRALQYLKEKYIVSSAPGKGMWTFKGDSVELPPAPIKMVVAERSYPVHGSGIDTVYGYAYEDDIKDSGDFQIKIGITAGHDEASRVRAQTATGAYKKTKILFAIRTDKSRQLESMIHSILKYQGRWLKDNENKEWFMTSVNQILAIYYTNTTT